MATGSKIYANAVAKYDEGKLLDEEKLRRIAEASYPDAVRMLYDYGYGEGVPVEEADAERILRVETTKLISFIKEYAPSETLKAFLLARYAFVNAKSAYKSKFTAVEESAFFEGFDELTEAVKSGAYDDLPYPELTLAMTYLDTLAATGTALKSREIDAAITKAEFAAEVRLSTRAGGRTREYVRRRADFTNALAAYRVHRFGGSEEDFEAIVVPGGALCAEELQPIVRGETETLIADLDCEYLAEPLGDLLMGGDIAEYERRAEEICSSVRVKDAEDMLSFDPFVAYVIGKSAEIAAIRLILVCIKNGAKDEIKRRLRRKDD